MKNVYKHLLTFYFEEIDRLAAIKTGSVSNQVVVCTHVLKVIKGAREFCDKSKARRTMINCYVYYT